MISAHHCTGSILGRRLGCLVACSKERAEGNIVGTGFGCFKRQMRELWQVTPTTLFGRRFFSIVVRQVDPDRCGRHRSQVRWRDRAIVQDEGNVLACAIGIKVGTGRADIVVACAL